jgi:hypothetical protein
MRERHQLISADVEIDRNVEVVDGSEIPIGQRRFGQWLQMFDRQAVYPLQPGVLARPVHLSSVPEVKTIQILAYSFQVWMHDPIS